MTTVSPPDRTQSFFGWLDYDDADARSMREVFGAFDDKETIDSLGLGVIRDSIADQLFPGISTVQTRARYFFFVPWVCQLIESERVAPSQFDDRLRELEVEVIESLRANDPKPVRGDGVIGLFARKKLSRLPSSVYWNGLGVFGIRLLNLSTGQYRTFVAQHGSKLGPLDTDDEGDPVRAARHMWDPALPTAPSGFPHEPLSLTLTQAESDYLAGKLATTGAEAMIGELARDLSVDRSAPMPWEVPLVHPTSRLAEVLRHARNFAQLMEGAQALYNLLLARRATERLDYDRATQIEAGEEEMDDWAALIAERKDSLTAWFDDEEFWSVVERETRVPARTRRFVLDWAHLALEDPAVITQSPDAAALIVRRERQLKGKLARLSEDRALESWAGEPFSPGQMTYRWGNARRILDDIEYHSKS